MLSFVLRAAAVLAGCAALFSTSAHAADPSLPEGFVAQPLATGLDAPTGFASRPDGTTYVIEKAGRVHRVTPGGARALWLDLNASPHVPPVNAWWDRGLVGVAVDGQWPARRFVYLLYVSDGWDDAADGRQDDDPHSSLLVRVPVLESGAAGTPQVILGADGMGDACPGPYVTPAGDLDDADYNDVDCLPIDGDTHAVGTVRSAADGTLYVGNGDGAGFDGIDQRAVRSQREDSLAGKILHVDRAGRGLPGHAFCPQEADLDRACAKLHATGFRNPFRFALLGEGRVAVGDVGWGTREELTLTPAGANAGWPCWEGTQLNSTYSGAALCRRIISSARPFTPVGVTLPDWEYDRVGTGGSIVGGPVYAGTSYPEAYRGSLLVGDYAQGWLRHLPADGAGGWQLAPKLVTDWAATSAQPLAGTAIGPGATPWVGVDIGAHPANGDVVYADIGEVSPFGAIRPNTGRLVRIRYLPGNGRPTARASATPGSGPAPLDVELSASESSDPDGDALDYAWDLDGDGETDETTATVPRTYPRAGAYTARVTVTDGYGLSDSATVTVRVEETPPVAEILASSDTTFAGGAPIVLRGRATDAQDGELTGDALRWDVQLVHNDHTHLLGTYSGTQPAVPDGIADHDSDSYYVITLTATDSAGLTDAVEWRLDPRTAAVRLRSVPTGVRLQYGDRSFTAPADHGSTIGLKTSITAPEEIERDGDRYAFAGWEDAATPRVRPFTVPGAGTTVTARYNGLPTVELAPENPERYRAGETVELRADARDPDGTLPAGAVAWRAQRVTADGAVGDPVTGSGPAFALTTAAADAPDAAYEVTVTVTDSDGATAEASTTLRPRTARVQLRSQPTGLVFAYDGEPLADGERRTSVVGARVTLSVPVRWGTLEFAGWSDRIATPVRGFEIPADDVTLTARYAPVPAPPTPIPTTPLPEPEPRVPAPEPPAPDQRGAGAPPAPRPTAGRVTLDRPRATPARRLTGRVLRLADARRVDVAVSHRRGSRCAWWSRAGRFTAPRSCTARAWLPAALSGEPADRRWRLELRGAVPPGPVTVHVRARTAQGRVLARATAVAQVPRAGAGR